MNGIVGSSQTTKVALWRRNEAGDLKRFLLPFEYKPLFMIQSRMERGPRLETGHAFEHEMNQKERADNWQTRKSD